MISNSHLEEKLFVDFLKYKLFVSFVLKPLLTFYNAIPVHMDFDL